MQQKDARDDAKRKYDAKKQGTEEAVEGEEGADGGAQAEVQYSDESDLDEALNTIDDETFEKIVEEAKALDF